MAGIRRRPAKDLFAGESARICTHMNDDHPDSVEAYAKHFAAISSVHEARMTSIESDGFTVEYKESATGPKQDVWIQFDTPVKSREEARTVLIQMAEEASKALGINVKHAGKFSKRNEETTHTTPSKPHRETPIWMHSIEVPPLTTIIPYITLWIITTYGAYGPPLPPTNIVFVQFENWREYAGGPEFFVRCLIAVLALHGVEALVCIGLGIWSRVHPLVILWYALSTLLLGVSSLKMMTKVSITEAGRRNETGLGGLTVFDWLGINKPGWVPDSFVDFEEDEEEQPLIEEIDDEEEEDGAQ